MKRRSGDTAKAWRFVIREEGAKRPAELRKANRATERMSNNRVLTAVRLSPSLWAMLGSLSSLIEVTALGLVTFAATNIDDLFVLVAFLSDPALRPRHIVLGQYAGIAALTVASMACAILTLAIPRPYVALLGFAPIAIGIKKVLERRAKGLADEDSPRPGKKATVLSVAAVTVANGGDNVAVYVPVFASHAWPQWVLLACLFAVLTGLWCLLAHGLVNHRTIGKPLRQYGRCLLPWVLIGLGAWILLSAHR